MKDATLANSLADAEVLAAYAIRNNLPGIQDAVEGIAEARESFEDGKVMGEAQKHFYADFSTLASRVAPVTVTTLKSSLAVYGPGRRTWFGLGPKVECSYAQRAASFYRTLATVVLLVLLAVQSYWLVGSNLLAAAPKLTAADRAALVQDSAEASIASTVEAQKAQAGSHPDLKAEVAEQAAVQAALELKNQQYEISRMLITWSHVLRFFVPSSWLPYTDNEMNQSGVEKSFMMSNEMDPDRIILLCSRILEVLQQYVLPLLYGWLGAMTYVLRILGQQARARLYSVDDEVGFNLRIWLGIVAGLAIGWFFRGDKGETTVAVGSISALALAFVAGYSVELLFTAMDRIVTAFSGAPEGTSQQQTAPPKPSVKKD